MLPLAWWICSNDLLVTKAGAPLPCVLWVLMSQQRPCFPETNMLLASSCSHQQLQCVLPSHMALAMRLFLAGKPRGAQRGHPRAAVLPAFVSIGLSCCNAARNRSGSTCRHNVVGSFHLTRSELCKFKVFIYYPKQFLTIIFSQVFQYCYNQYGQAKNPVPQTDGAYEGETIINANKIL